MFKISNNTLFMEFDGSNTLVMEADADYVFDGDVIPLVELIQQRTRSNNKNTFISYRK